MNLFSHIQDSIPAPEAVALYLYDNAQRKLSLQTQMGLQEDCDTLVDMAAVARKAAGEHLELDIPNYRTQSAEALSNVTDEVLKQCKKIRKYTDGWPVTRYMHIYLKNYHPKKKGRSKGKTKPSTTRIRPGPGRHSAGFTAARVEDPSSSIVETDRNAGGITQSGEWAGPSRHIAATPEYRDVVPRFLYDLKLPSGDVDRLTKLFKKMGIESTQYLDIFATMETRDVWLEELVDEGELTPIQVRVLKEGLDRLGRMRSASESESACL